MVVVKSARKVNEYDRADPIRIKKGEVELLIVLREKTKIQEKGEEKYVRKKNSVKTEGMNEWLRI